MPLFWLSLAVMAGILLGSTVELPRGVWIAGAAAGLAGLVLEKMFVRRPRAGGMRWWLRLPVGALMIGLCLGGLRYSLNQSSFGPVDLAFYNDSEKTQLTGWVDSYPDVRANTVLLQVRIETLRSGMEKDRVIRGRALLRLAPGAEWHYGDRVEIWGSPLTPPQENDFSYKDYLARQGIHTYFLYPALRKVGDGAGSWLLAGIYDLREYAYRTINRLFTQPEAALLSGVLLGLERDLPDSLVQAFQDTGTAHIVAISGFNMTILSALLLSLLRRFLPRGWSALAAAVTISFYTLLVGANPAVVRAAIMGSLALFGRLIGRGSSGLTPLAFSAAVMCLFNPLLPWDAGFQLSFTATLGLILYGEPLQRSFEAWAAGRWGESTAKKVAGPVSEYFLFTLAAQVTTLPVILYHFGRVSMLSLIANPLILPVQPGIMVLGGLALLVGMVLQPLGQILAWLSWPLAAYTLRVVEGLAGVSSGALAPGKFTPLMALICYVLLFALTLRAGWLEKLRSKIKPGLVLGGLGVITFLVWSTALRMPDGKLHIILPAGADASAAFVRLPRGDVLLVGGSGDGNALSASLGDFLGPLNRQIEGLVITSARADDIKALPVLMERFAVKQGLWTFQPLAKPSVDRVIQSLQDHNTDAMILEPRTEVQLDEGVTLRVIAANQDGAAIQVRYGNLCLLWPGSFSAGGIPQSGQHQKGCLLLGSGVLDAAQWAEMRPLGVVVTGGGASAGPETLSTDANGQIEIISDGEKLWIEVERQRD